MSKIEKIRQKLDEKLSPNMLMFISFGIVLTAVVFGVLYAG